MTEFVVKTVDENTGIEKSKLNKLIREELNIDGNEANALIDTCIKEGKIRAIELNGKKNLYPTGNASSNKAYFGNEKPKTTVRIKPLIIMLFVGLIIAALVLYTPLTYFFVIGLIVYCIFSWVFSR